MYLKAFFIFHKSYNPTNPVQTIIFVKNIAYK
jgi:hypothetical protein